MSKNTLLREQHRAMVRFIQALGFDPELVAAELADAAPKATCKHIALLGLRVTRDFSTTAFSPEGIAAANRWLDSIQLPGPRPEEPTA